MGYNISYYFCMHIVKLYMWWVWCVCVCACACNVVRHALELPLTHCLVCARSLVHSFVRVRACMHVNNLLVVADTHTHTRTHDCKICGKKLWVNPILHALPSPSFSLGPCPFHLAGCSNKIFIALNRIYMADYVQLWSQLHVYNVITNFLCV